MRQGGAKANLELILAKDVKNNKKIFVKDINNKRKTKDNVGLLLNGGGELVRYNSGKAELLNTFLYRSSLTRTALRDL